jgi:hypothetical protein
MIAQPVLLVSEKVYRKPDGRFVLCGPRHPMGSLCANQDLIARPKMTLVFSLDAQTGRAGEEQHPFVMGLAVGTVGRRGLTGRDDPLDPHIFSCDELGDGLAVATSRKVAEKIDHGRAGAKLRATTVPRR